MTKRWKDPTDYWNIKLFTSLLYRNSEGTPILRAYTGPIPTCFIPANISAGSKTTLPKHREGFAHFYLDDYQFERFWNFPVRYVRYLQTFQGALSPDYSVFSDYPLPLQRFNVYRNRALGAYWQHMGIPVIPSISWNTLESLQYCFDAVEKHSLLSISTVGVLRKLHTKKILLSGYAEMIRVLEPIGVLIYGVYPKELDDFGVPNYRIPAFYEKFETTERVISLES